MTTFLIIALLTYNAWLAYHLLSRPSASKGQTASQEETKKKREAQDEAADVVGKSRFKMEASVPAQQERTTPLAATTAPQAATQEKTEAVDIEDTIFADETDEKPSRQVPTDRLDEVIDLYTARAAEAKPLVLPVRIEDFDIRDFV